VGPDPQGEPEFHPYHHPAAGWGAAKSVSRLLVRERALVDGPRAIMRMNHENTGFDCPGCAWPDDTKGLHLDICENGIKHVTWEMTGKRVGREFFAAHSVTELFGWSDYDLEDQGRLTEPMVYDPESDTTCRSAGATRSNWPAACCAGWAARTRRRSTRPGG